jgi:hypothetical protein
MNSMTGFGAAKGECLGRHFTVEVRSFNHRFLEVKLRLPPGCTDPLLDQLLREVVRKKVQRGSLVITISETTAKRGCAGCAARSRAAAGLCAGGARGDDGAACRPRAGGRAGCPAASARAVSAGGDEHRRHPHPQRRGVSDPAVADLGGQRWTSSTRAGPAKATRCGPICSVGFRSSRGCGMKWPR